MITPEQERYLKRKFKIPVDSFNPETYWIVSLDRESLMPTEQEMRQIRKYCEFSVKRTYNESYQNIIFGYDLPKCGGHNTVVLRKGLGTREDHQNAWFFRRVSWSGCGYSPRLSQEGYTPQSLVEIIDTCEGLASAKWLQWKARHPKVYPPKVMQAD